MEMKILLLSVGTRGDMEPFLAVAELLREKGHDVVCVFPEQYAYLAEDAGLKFRTLGSEFIELIEGDDGKMAMGGKGSILKKAAALWRLYGQSKSINEEMVARQHTIVESEQPDRIVYGGKAIYPILWGIGNPDRSILLSPIPYLIHPVKDHPHIGFSRNFGTLLNTFTYSLANFGLIQTVVSTNKTVRNALEVSRRQIKASLFSKKMIYAISPTIFSRPDYWPDYVQVLGYHERKNDATWDPDQELKDFISQHDNMLFITFGSMTNPEPEAKTKIILDILGDHQIPAIINTAAGGLVEPKMYNRDLIKFVSRIPYDWIFPQMFGVIHHGGSGTTHLALKHGCASLVIPHIMDQFVWKDRVHALGAGPDGTAMRTLSRSKMEPKILDLLSNQKYRIRAKEIGARMRSEDYREQLYRFIVDI